VPFDEGLCPGARHRGSTVIQCPFASQTGDGRIDVFGPEFTARQSLANLSLGQLAPRKPS
jgi:hypothetical protein